jgi:hypothetical protein
MQNATFVGEVLQGQVAVPPEFEGKRVIVTLADPAPAAAPPQAPEDESVELEDCGRIDMPMRDVKTVKFIFTEVGRLPMRDDYADHDCEVWDDQ